MSEYVWFPTPEIVDRAQPGIHVIEPVQRVQFLHRPRRHEPPCPARREPGDRGGADRGVGGHVGLDQDVRIVPRLIARASVEIAFAQ